MYILVIFYLFVLLAGGHTAEMISEMLVEESVMQFDSEFLHNHSVSSAYQGACQTSHEELTGKLPSAINPVH